MGSSTASDVCPRCLQVREMGEGGYVPAYVYKSG